MDQETKRLLIKVIADGFTALYGLYATVTDFHETRKGKKILSWRGYLGIFLLVFASGLTIFQDAKKEEQDNANAREQQFEYQKQLANETELSQSLKAQRGQLTSQQHDLTTAITEVRKTASATSAVLDESRRANDPLGRIVAIDINFSLPIESKPVQSYLERLETVGVDVGQNFNFPPKTPGFPDFREPHEAVLQEAATPMDAQVGIFLRRRKQSSPTGRAVPGASGHGASDPFLSFVQADRSWAGDCNPNYFHTNLVAASPGGGRQGAALYFECYVSQVASKSSAGPLLSHLDLNGAWFLVYMGPGSEGLAHLPFTVDVTLYEEGGTQIYVDGFERTISEGFQSFYAKIGPNSVSTGGYGWPLLQPTFYKKLATTPSTHQ